MSAQGIYNFCESGGIGRRAGFRFQWGNSRESSSLSFRTIFVFHGMLDAGVISSTFPIFEVDICKSLLKLLDL